MPQTPTRTQTNLPRPLHSLRARAQRRMPQSRRHEAQEAQFGGAEDGEGEVEHGESGELLYSGGGT